MGTPISEATPLQLKAAREHRERHARLNQPANAPVPPKPRPKPRPKQVPPVPTPHLSVALIQETIARDFAVTRAAIIGPGHSHRLTTIRYASMLLCFQLLPLISTTKVGRLHNRDHSTVIHGLDRIQRTLLTDPELAAKIERCRQKIIAAVRALT